MAPLETNGLPDNGYATNPRASCMTGIGSASAGRSRRLRRTRIVGLVRNVFVAL